MPLKIKCPEGHELVVPTQRAGTRVRCPICKSTVAVPNIDPAALAERKERLQEKQSPSATAGQPAKEIAKPADAPTTKPTTAASKPPAEKPTPKAIVPAPKTQSQQAASTPPAESTKKNLPDAKKQEQVAVPPPKPQRTSKQPSPSAKVVPTKQVAEKPAATSKPTGPPALPPTQLPPKLPTRAKSPEGSTRPKSATPKTKPAKPGKERKKPEPEEKPKVRGVQHNRAKRFAAYYLGIGLTLIGLLTISPGVLDVITANSGEAARPVATWAFGTMFIGLLQLLYVVYLVQVPDWSSVWVVSILNLAITTFYATMMGLLFMGDQENPILFSLDLAYIRKKALIWCVSMMSISALLTYLSGRIGVRWQRTYNTTVAATEGGKS